MHLTTTFCNLLRIASNRISPKPNHSNNRSSVARVCDRFNNISRRFFQKIQKRQGVIVAAMEVDGKGGSKCFDSPSQQDHLMRTSSKTRDKNIHLMTVTDIKDLSGTVKEVVLAAEETPPRFTFKAGQWVDVFIPGIETVGGFSMSSSPQELLGTGKLRLAIKYSAHPPALWMHKSCKIGDTLELRVGGDFYVSSDKLHSTADNKILLIAGGVGINPLSSIVRFLQDGKKEGAISSPTRVCLLFSAKNKDELLFQDSFDSYRNADHAFNVVYFATGSKSSLSDNTVNGNGSILKSRRIGMEDIVDAANWLQKSEGAIAAGIQTYICGPPSMIKTMSDVLLKLKFKTPNFEQWW